MEPLISELVSLSFVVIFPLSLGQNLFNLCLCSVKMMKRNLILYSNQKYKRRRNKIDKKSVDKITQNEIKSRP